MPEEGFSFFEIQTPLKTSLYFPEPKWPTPQHLGGGGGRSYGRLGLPSISATRKLSENTKK